MKNLRSITLIAALSALMWSCNDKGGGDPTGPTDGEGKLTAPSLSAEPSSAIVLEQAKASQTALTLSWTSASNESGVVVNYDIYINLSTKDLFTDPYKIEAGTALSKSLTHGELNSIALGLGAGFNTAAPFKIGIHARHANGSYEAVISNEVTATITPYMEYPEYFVIVGEALPWKWTQDDAGRIMQTSAGSGRYLATDIELNMVNSTMGFKLYYPKVVDVDQDFLAQDPDSDTFGKIKVFTSGDDQFLPAQNGYEKGIFTITIDLGSMLVSLEKTGDLVEKEFPDNLWLFGNCFTEIPAWGFGEDPTTGRLNQTEEGVYTLENVIMKSSAGDQFKFMVAHGTYYPQYGQSEEISTFGAIEKFADDGPSFFPFGNGYTSGYYTVSANLKTKELTLTKTQDIEESQYPESISLAGDAMPWKWNRDDPRSVATSTEEGIYELTTTLELGDDGWNGFKFWTTSGWDQEHVQDPAGTFGAIVLKDGSISGDPQFFPGILPPAENNQLPESFPCGNLSADVNYLITINLKTMMMTFTAK